MPATAWQPLCPVLPCHNAGQQFSHASPCTNADMFTHALTLYSHEGCLTAADHVASDGDICACLQKKMCSSYHRVKPS